MNRKHMTFFDNDMFLNRFVIWCLLITELNWLSIILFIAVFFYFNSYNYFVQYPVSCIQLSGDFIRSPQTLMYGYQKAFEDPRQQHIGIKNRYTMPAKNIELIMRRFFLIIFRKCHRPQALVSRKMFRSTMR